MAKKSTKSTTPMVINPWLKISWKNTVANCDKKVIHPLFCTRKGINISTLPCPYSGDPKSKVYCLSLNPGTGISLPYFVNDTAYEKMVQDNLHHRLGYFMWLRPVITKCGTILHDGSVWWHNRTKELRKAVGKNDLDIFSLEYFPYHTQHSINFPALPSDDYRNYLLDKAMDNNKLIVIMRSEKLWYGIRAISSSDIPLGDKLRNYKNKIVLKNQRSIYLTQNNMDSKDWAKLSANV